MAHHDKISKGNQAGALNLLDHDKRRQNPNRKRSNENIDKTLTRRNKDLSKRKMTPSEAWKHALSVAEEHSSRAIRDNMVIISSEVIHLPSNWDEIARGEDAMCFFEKIALPFYRERYGRGEDCWNEISAVVHRDEVVQSGPNKGKITPHMHYKYVPITVDGKLSHKIVNGKKDLSTLHKDLTAFAEGKGYAGLNLYDEERAQSREKALTMPEYKEAQAEIDKVRQEVIDERQKLDETSAELSEAAERLESVRRSEETEMEEVHTLDAGIAAAEAEIDRIASEIERENGRIQEIERANESARSRIGKIVAAIEQARASLAARLRGVIERGKTALPFLSAAVGRSGGGKRGLVICCLPSIETFEKVSAITGTDGSVLEVEILDREGEGWSVAATMIEPDGTLDTVTAFAATKEQAYENARKMAESRGFEIEYDPAQVSDGETPTIAGDRLAGEAAKPAVPRERGVSWTR